VNNIGQVGGGYGRIFSSNICRGVLPQNLS